MFQFSVLVGSMSNPCSKQIGSILVASLEMFVSMSRVSQNMVNYVIYNDEHQAKDCAREKLTFAMTECCLILFCATVVIAGTRAYVGLFLQ